MKHDLEKMVQKHYEDLLERISHRYVEGQAQAIRSVNESIVNTNWDIGRYIVEFEQGGKSKAKYGTGLLENLSRDLTFRHGRGFSRSNLSYMRLFYRFFPNCETLSHKLSWSHYCELVKIDNELERSFYYQQNILENWSIRELKRQKESGLFLRLTVSKDKDKVLALSKNGQLIETPEDVVKDVYVFEFLKISEPYIVSENELESRLIDNLQNFLLELGKGFTFVGRQYRIILNNTVYRVDLVFYHRILRCFVLIDLKINEVEHGDIGQMNMYMGYFDKEENVEGDNPPIGIILSKEKDELLVEYATYGMSSQLFVSKYQLYLPNKEDLRRLLHNQLNEAL
ncbi:MAG: PDDEXK nuclease domain-containing protein [Chitinispirillia bacterium]|nr:PDDEXK nuclease domain-containing protein [Chitinispirillia bacterium]MCL2269363.1 PDDEXK nuclease domain-containing protein [Chitinispirillia bacterium]